MGRKIEWSDKAITSLTNTFNYLKSEVSYQSAVNFVTLIEKRVELIEKNPTSGRKVVNRKTIRFILVGSHHWLYYRVHGSTLFISAIFDTKQNPEIQNIEVKKKQKNIGYER